MAVSEGVLLWRGSGEFVSHSRLAAFMAWLAREHHIEFNSYADLHRWSVDDIDFFWALIWDYFEIQSETPYQHVLGNRDMPGAEWFPGARVNYAEHFLRHECGRANDVALVHCSERRPLARTTWRELGGQVRRLATFLRARGVKPGDCVVAYMPNVPETVVAMLATTAIGAVWSSAAPEFGVQAVVDRFGQIAPKVLFASDGYSFGGTVFDRRGEVAALVRDVPSIERVIWLDYMNLGAPTDPGVQLESWADALAIAAPSRETFEFARVDNRHPLWILFSSGTTGLPKAIVHSHIGILVEQLKLGAFHLDLGPSSVMFFYSTTGWMMWNALMMAPLNGGTAVLYDGSPMQGGFDFLWRLASQSRATMFGASPTYIELMRKHGIVPKDLCDLSAIRAVLMSGSPATPECFEWFYENVKKDLWVTSQSGGTEFCAGLVVGAPILPVYAGEIQARALGCDVRVLDDNGRELIDQVGELVVAQPMPSMPIYFWGDDNYERYRETYFDVYPGVWRHGDFMKINRRGGCYVYGRSDSTLNRFGVRIGSSEIYRTLEAIEEVLDSLVVCTEEPGGGFFMPLFIQLREGKSLDDALLAKIKSALRTERSPRHVPDVILGVPAIPYTLSGKKMEVPVRKLLMGWEPERAYSRDSMKDGAAMDWFIAFASERNRPRTPAHRSAPQG